MLKTLYNGFLLSCLLITISCTTNQNSSDLIRAIDNRQTDKALRIIDQLKNLNEQDSLGLSPMHWAAKRALPQITKALIKKGCNLNITDAQGYTPLNYAIKADNAEIINLMLKKQAVVYKNGLSNLSDGPFVDWTEKGLYAYYLKHDSISSKSFLSGKFINQNTRCFKGWNGDTTTYTITDNKIPEWEFKTQEPIFVLGDIHGQYDRMVKNLQAHGVIDKHLKWNWGKGHLVFVGDIFDRGNKVTEALWLIYKLEQEADKVGGKVHISFGNHELMVLNKDNRYIASDYKNLCNNLGLEYNALFHSNSVLGEWLRSKNSMTKINDILFVHGGISQKQIDSGMSTQEINELVRQYLISGSSPKNQDKLNQILKSFGPFWYRGYFMDRSQYKKITEQELTSILEALKVSRVVVGHTENDELSALYNGKVIDVNIPLAEDSIPNQALLIKDGKFFRLTEDGNKTLLN